VQLHILASVNAISNIICFYSIVYALSKLAPRDVSIFLDELTYCIYSVLSKCRNVKISEKDDNMLFLQFASSIVTTSKQNRHIHIVLAIIIELRNEISLVSTHTTKYKIIIPTASSRSSIHANLTNFGCLRVREQYIDIAILLVLSIVLSIVLWVMIKYCNSIVDHVVNNYCNILFPNPGISWNIKEIVEALLYM
jgi:hypothetical protein